MSETTGTGASRTVLNQIIAIEKSVKKTAKDAQTEAYQHIGKNDTPLSGLVRTYQPLREDGVQYPDEETRVQIRVEDVVAGVGKLTARLFDVTATKDLANQGATADLIVDGEVIVDAVPVTFLLTLEKELVDWHTMLTKLPELDISEEWSPDADANAYRSKPKSTIRTSKQPRVITLSPPTDRHPAQVQLLQEDVAEGTWTAVKFSGKIPGARKAELLANTDKLIQATKMAREAANNIHVVDSDAGQRIIGFLNR
jgi:hypothetical protein